MGDGDHRAPVHQLQNAVLNQVLGLAVQGGCGFIEDQDRSVLEEGARDGHPLAFAARKLHALLAHDGVVAAFARRDEVVAMGELRGLGQFVVAGGRAAVDDFVAYRTVEDARRLRNFGESLVQRIPGDSGDILAVDDDAPTLNGELAAQEPEQRALARTRRADHADLFARRDGEVEVCEHWCAVGVVECDVVHVDPAAGDVQRSGVRRIDNVMRLGNGLQAVGQHTEVLEKSQQAVAQGVDVRRDQQGQ